jgi:hypothetical protein
MVRMLGLAIAIVAGGLGCGGTPVPETTPKGPTQCERVGDHLVGLMTKGYADLPAEQQPTEVIDKLTKVIIDLCTRGGWSADAQQCFLKLGSLTEDLAQWDTCAGYLTVEQRDQLPKAVDAAFGSRTTPAAPAEPAPAEAPTQPAGSAEPAESR